MAIIKVHGVGRVYETPDIVVCKVAIRNFDYTEPQARLAASKLARKVCELFRKKGVKEEDSSISAPEVDMVGEHRKRVRHPQKYLSETLLQFKIRDFTKVEGILAGVSAIDTETIQVVKLYHTLESQKEAQQRARQLAFQDAEAKALLYAKGGGFSKVRFTDIDDDSHELGQNYGMSSSKFRDELSHEDSVYTATKFAVTVKIEVEFVTTA